MKIRIILLIVLFMTFEWTLDAQVIGSYTDSTGSNTNSAASFRDTRDNTIYKTVVIGAQTWMAENLNFKSKDSWCYKYDSSNCAIYGRLYTWTIAKNVCPAGWHLPNNDEWTILVNNLGGKNVAGGKMKEAGTSHWKSPNKGATDSIGFTALPAGNLDVIGVFLSIGDDTSWWSSTESNSGNAWFLDVNKYSAKVYTDVITKQDRLSVRCIKD